MPCVDYAMPSLSDDERVLHEFGMSFDHVRAGRIVEDWTVWDRGGLARLLSDESGS